MILVPCTITRAKEFVRNYHRHNKPPVGGLFAIGLKEEGSLVGVAIVGRPVARMLQDGETCEVTRLCVLPDAPRNASSKLYGAARRAAQALGYSRCITYTLQSESGASLRGAGWECKAFLLEREGWTCPSRPRGAGTVDHTAKIRWETQ